MKVTYAYLVLRRLQITTNNQITNIPLAISMKGTRKGDIFFSIVDIINKKGDKERFIQVKDLRCEHSRVIDAQTILDSIK